jgi:thioester reductase-like protein
LAGFEQDLELDASIAAERAADPPRWPPANILLTGGTGFLGRYLLRELLRSTEARVHCLVRARSVGEGLERLRHPEIREAVDGAAPERLTVLLGDVAKPRLGLEQSELDRLGVEVDAIVHNAAAVNLLYPYRALRAANVGSVVEVLRLAVSGRLKPVQFVSTAAVVRSPDVATVVREDEDLDHFRANLTQGYTQTKWVAEKLLAIARARGVPGSVFRPGYISGDSETGAGQLADARMLVLRACIQRGCAPALDKLVDLTPVDYVSRALVQVARGANTGTFHLYNEQRIAWPRIVEELNRFGYPIELVPYEQWRATFEKPHIPASERLVGDRKLHGWLLGASWSLDCRATRAALAGSGVECPPLDAPLLHRYFAYLQSHGAFS